MFDHVWYVFHCFLNSSHAHCFFLFTFWFRFPRLKTFHLFAPETLDPQRKSEGNLPQRLVWTLVATPGILLNHFGSFQWTSLKTLRRDEEFIAVSSSCHLTLCCMQKVIDLRIFFTTFLLQLLCFSWLFWRLPLLHLHLLNPPHVIRIRESACRMYGNLSHIFSIHFLKPSSWSLQAAAGGQHSSRSAVGQVTVSQKLWIRIIHASECIWIPACSLEISGIRLGECTSWCLRSSLCDLCAHAWQVSDLLFTNFQSLHSDRTESLAKTSWSFRYSCKRAAAALRPRTSTQRQYDITRRDLMKMKNEKMHAAIDRVIFLCMCDHRSQHVAIPKSLKKNNWLNYVPSKKTPAAWYATNALPKACKSNPSVL